MSTGAVPFQRGLAGDQPAWLAGVRTNAIEVLDAIARVEVPRQLAASGLTQTEVANDAARNGHHSAC